MPEIINQFTKSIGDILGSPLVQTAVQGIAIFWVLLWLAAAYWAFRDMQLRTENPVLPYLAAALVIAFTPILFPAAIILYKIVRPQERIGEVYERNLAEEALLAEVESVQHCPTCVRRIDDEWIICPSCRTRLKRVCPNCSRLVGLDWSLCAWCGKDFERREIAAAYVTELPTATRPKAIEAPSPTPLAQARTAQSRATRTVRAARTASDPLPES
jgi:double zinc ribbon protein